MNPGNTTRRSSVVLLVALLVLLSTAIAGCGGGSQGGQQGNSKDKASQQQETKKAKKKKKNAPEVKIALGTIVFHNPDTQRFTLRPNKGKPKIFHYNKKTKITLNGKKAGSKDIEKSMRAQAKYIVKDNLPRVRELDLTGKGGSGGGETTG